LPGRTTASAAVSGNSPAGPVDRLNINDYR
jgi:hypothetical protein